MEKLIRIVASNKNNKRSLNSFVKCFTLNEKAKELYRNNKTFTDVKNYISTKKVS